MKIVVNNRDKNVSNELLKACDNNEIFAKILYNRGIRSVNDLKLCMDYKNYNPYDPMEFLPMVKACEMIKKAMDNKEKIAVYGDYDVDGITATSVLVLGLRELKADVIYHVPDRFSEGYGMNLEVVGKLYDEGVKTIITCDCGISNFDEISRAKELGIKVILTDHHNIGEKIPCADVVINYKLLPDNHPVRNVSGCATAYFLVKALYKYLNKEMQDDYLDLVALSIISDVIPLRDESRFLFKKGFEKLKSPKRLGLNALLELIHIEDMSVEDIGFQITPRLNAVGRMDTAKTAVELFLTDNKEAAENLAIEIDRFNTDRKNIQNEVYLQAKEIVETQKKNKKILVLFGESWHHGIIGIVAGKICEEYKKPCIILSQNENGDIVGSARSTEHLNIYETLTKFSNYLIKFGGHSQAAGLSLKAENLEKFTKEIEEYVDVYLTDEFEETIFVDYILPFNKISFELLETLTLGEPYGADFPEPMFVTTDVKILRETINKGTHHFMTLADNTKKEIGTTLWNYGDESLQGRECTIIYNIYRDTYNGRNEIKIKIHNIIFEPVEISENSINWVDRRNKDISDIIKEYNGCEIFYEGPMMFKPNLPTISHNYDKKISSLVLYSLPKSNKILHELIENTSPNCVVLNYSYIPKYDMLSFQKTFMGAIKNIINNSEGKTNTKNLAFILQVDEEFISTYSKLLADYGYFDVDFSEDGELKYSIIQNKKGKPNNYLANIVTRYLKEKEEYVKYMVKTPICVKRQEEEK